jgi:hypothetical protein
MYTKMTFYPNRMTATELAFAIIALSGQVDTNFLQKALSAQVGNEDAAAIIDQARRAFNGLEG